MRKHNIFFTNRSSCACLFLTIMISCPSFAEEALPSDQASDTTSTIHQALIAETPVAETPPPRGSLFERWFDSFEDMHDSTSRHYMSMVRSIDSYFSGEKIEESSNGSYMKLELQNTFYKGGEQDDGVSINAKVELPYTEKHFKLIFSSDPEEDKTLEQKIKNNASGQRVEKDSSIAGVEYSPETTDTEWEHSFSTGVKIRLHPIPFMRYKFGKQWQLNEKWGSEFKQSLWSYRDDGLGSTTRLAFGRPLTEKDYFKSDTEAEYINDDGKYYYAQTFSNTHILSKESAIGYWIGVLGESQPDSEVTNYLIGTQYRRAVYKDWILLTISPLLDFPREEDWEMTPSLTFGLQVYFTE